MQTELKICPTCSGSGVKVTLWGDPNDGYGTREWCPTCQGATNANHKAQSTFRNFLHQGSKTLDLKVAP